MKYKVGDRVLAQDDIDWEARTGTITKAYEDEDEKWSYEIYFPDSGSEEFYREYEVIRKVSKLEKAIN